MSGYPSEVVDEQLKILSKKHGQSEIAMGCLYGVYIVHSVTNKKPVSLIDFENNIPDLIKALKR